MDAASLGVAFAAGLVSFVSPCCLPLIPTYVTYLTGSSYEELTGGSLAPDLRRRVIVNALAFILGFSVIFIALGLTASTVGQFLRAIMSFIRQLSGIVVVALGLHMMGFLRLPFLEREMRANVPGASGGAGLRRSFLVGATFSAGWSPCIGPVLSGILLLASQAGTASAGGVLLGFYSLGLAIPFLMTALGLGTFVRYFPRIARRMAAIRFASGLLMVIVGLMIYSNMFTVINGWFNWGQTIGL